MLDEFIKVVGKLLCKIGFHKFECKIKDVIDEFGYIPSDGRMPKSAKCKRCHIGY